MSLYREHMGEAFNTITTDKGPEFSQLASLEDLTETLSYYAHPIYLL